MTGRPQNPRIASAASRRKDRSRAVIGYLRVSTEEQATSGLGLADQRVVVTREAERRGWGAVTFLVDEGYSAKNLTRPAIDEALRRLACGEAAVLVVSKLDRLSRSILDFVTLMDRAKREGWSLVVLDLGIDMSTPSGSLMANVMACFAEYERRLIGARTSASLQQKKAQGARLGRPRTLASDVTERIVRERASGASLRTITAGLMRDGVPTARGGTWQVSTVAGVLRSAALDQEAARLRSL